MAARTACIGKLKKLRHCQSMYTYGGVT